MRENNDKINDTLIDALGMIDDKLIADAQSPDRVLSNIKAKRRFLQTGAIAACVALAVMGGGVLLSIDPPSSSPSKENSANETTSGISDNLIQSEEKQESDTLTALLTEAERSPLSHSVSVDDIDFYDGNMSLVWRERGEESVHMLAVSKENQSALQKSIEAVGAVQLTAEEAEQIRYEIWICMGDGRVLSPQLKYSKGNIGHASLFEYAPEQEPTEQFIKEVYGLINPT